MFGSGVVMMLPWRNIGGAEPEVDFRAERRVEDLVKSCAFFRVAFGIRARPTVAGIATASFV